MKNLFYKIGKATCISTILVLLSFQSYAKLIPSDSVPKTAQKSYIGFYLMNLYDMDFSMNSFYADFYVWAKWKGELNPLTNIEFVNYIEKWGFTKEFLYDTTQVFPDGTNYNVLRIEGRFFQKFYLKKYPIDVQNLEIKLENAVYTRDELVYLPLTEESGISDELHLPGWKIKEYSLKAYTNQYPTNFGDNRKTKSETYSNLTFNIKLERPINFFLWKLMLPLLVVLATSLGATFIYPLYIDARIYLPIGGLLSAVFLQQSYTDTLPDVSYLVLMDKIYVLSYIIITINLIQAIITANMVSSEAEEDVLRVKKIDKKFALITLMGFIAFALAIICTA